MENIREERRTPIGRIDRLENDLNEIKLARAKAITEKEKKILKYPNSWRRTFAKATKKNSRDKIIVEYHNAKGEIEPPMLLPLLAGNLIIYNDQAHRFDPRTLWWRKIGNKYYRVLALREIDRQPISNLDVNEIVKRGDWTRDDKLFLKMLKLAMVEKVKKQTMNKGIWIILGLLAAAGIIIYLFMK